VASVRHKRHLVAPEAADVVRRATGDLVGLDDVLGLLVGDLPLDAAVAGERRLPDGDLEVTFDGPDGTRAVAVIDDPTAAPVSLVVTDADQQRTLSATWEPFAVDTASGLLLPTEAVLEAPRLGLELRLQYKSWTFPEVAPDVFGLAPPEGFASGPLELAAADALAALVSELATDE
jgi:hypothetical protein